MLISELVAALNKINQIAGDIPIVLRHVEQDAETAVTALVLAFDPSGAAPTSKVIVAHDVPATVVPADVDAATTIAP